MANLRQAKKVAGLMRLLGRPEGVGILQLLAERERNVEALGAAVDLPRPQVSNLLTKFRLVGLVEYQTEGSTRGYRLTDQDRKLVEALGKLG